MKVIIAYNLFPDLLIMIKGVAKLRIQKLSDGYIEYETYYFFLFPERKW